jgi:hypothetical protein
MLAVLEARLEKNHAAQQKVACSRAPCGSQYDVHSMQVAEAATTVKESSTKHPHPA